MLTVSINTVYFKCFFFHIFIQILIQLLCNLFSGSQTIIMHSMGPLWAAVYARMLIFLTQLLIELCLRSYVNSFVLRLKMPIVNLLYMAGITIRSSYVMRSFLFLHETDHSEDAARINPAQCMYITKAFLIYGQ